MKQTAVEWLVDELSQWDIKYTEAKGKISKEVYETTKNYFQEQAKQKEREQMNNILTWYQSKSQEYRNDTLLVDAVNDYYETTFKTK